MSSIEAGNVTVEDDGTITKYGMAALYFDVILEQESPFFPNRLSPPNSWVSDLATWTARIDAALIKMKKVYARQANALARGLTPPHSWVDRCFSQLGTEWVNLASGGAVTFGARYRLKVNRPIYGLRFGWMTSGGSTVLVAKVWNDTSGGVEATESITVANSGIYSCIFSTPISKDLTSTDISCSLYSVSTRYTKTVDDSWNANCPFELDDRLTIKHLALTGVGDVRPTNLALTQAMIIEPIL